MGEQGCTLAIPNLSPRQARGRWLEAQVFPTSGCVATSRPGFHPRQVGLTCR